MLYLIVAIELGVLIMVHEGGHFLIARLSGMRVDKFSIGFGPALAKFTRGETTYQIGAIPLGGFVQIAGLNPGDDSVAPDDPRAYPNRPVYQRLLTIFAGPGTNYVFAALLMAITWVSFGVSMPGKMPIVGGLVEGRPAFASGLQLEDEIVSVDGHAVKDMDDVAPIIDASRGRRVKVVVLRDHTQELTYSIAPVADADGKFRIGIQIVPNKIRVRQPFGQAFLSGLVYPYQQTRDIMHGFAEIFRGRQKAEFSGPLGIVLGVGKVMKRHVALDPAYALEVMAFLSVSLGWFNLLPIPALDGGRLVFLAYEGVLRRRVNQRFEQRVHLVGMLILLGFVLFVTIGHDIPMLFH